MSETPENLLRSEVAQSMALDQIRYSQVWEDHLLLEDGLEIGPGDDVLSVTSAGCNVLALLLREPRSVTAFDMSPAQTALLELKLAGIRQLSHDEFTGLVGVRDGFDRWALYQRVSGDISDTSKAYWDGHRDDLDSGVIHCGRLETYFSIFRTEHLPNVWSPATVDTLLDGHATLAEQKARFDRALTPEFKGLFVWYFGRDMLEKNGRDPAQFRYVEGGDVGGYFLNRFRFALTELPIKGNFYMEFFLRGGYRELTLAHPYLHPDNFDRLKGLIDRIVIVTDELERFLSNTASDAFSKANLSDIFEYMSEGDATQVFRTLMAHFRPGGRLAYWNLLVPRGRPEMLANQLRPLRDLSHILWERDRSYFYRDFHVDEVLA
jgi:S-adenosylmethionine-diacylglycerol 3-amino-3-carboxypropyl transferase